MAFYAACQRHMMVQYCCDSGITNKLFCKCFLLRQEANLHRIYKFPTVCNGYTCIIVMSSIDFCKSLSFGSQDLTSHLQLTKNNEMKVNNNKIQCLKNISSFKSLQISDEMHMTITHLLNQIESYFSLKVTTHILKTLKSHHAIHL